MPLKVSQRASVPPLSFWKNLANPTIRTVTRGQREAQRPGRSGKAPLNASCTKSLNAPQFHLCHPVRIWRIPRNEPSARGQREAQRPERTGATAEPRPTLVPSKKRDATTPRQAARLEFTRFFQNDKGGTAERRYTAPTACPHRADSAATAEL